jgi:hypothetical protein
MRVEDRLPGVSTLYVIVQRLERYLLIPPVSFSNDLRFRPALTEPRTSTESLANAAHQPNANVAVELRSFKITEVLEGDAPPVRGLRVQVVEVDGPHGRG